jgi:dihydrofolate reductase
VRPQRIEGYAIISADGMLADASGQQPAELIVPADQRLFHQALARSAAVAHGRHSQEGGAARARERKRLVLTRRIAGLAPHPDYRHGMLWNPGGASLEQAWRALGAPDGTLAVIGGTDTFGLFLELGYDAFHLTRADRVRLPGGRPVFPGVPARTPEALLAEHGLQGGPVHIVDPEAGVTMVSWDRRPTG